MIGKIGAKYARTQWETMIDTSGISPSEAPVILDTTSFFRELAKGVIAPGGIHARIAELFTKGQIKMDVEEFVYKIMQSGVLEKQNESLPEILWDRVKRSFPRKPEEVAMHYDMPGVFPAMLDTATGSYTSPLTSEAESLEDNQKASLELRCSNWEIDEGMDILEIGFGNGGFANHVISTRSPKSYRGLTISQGQTDLATKNLDHNGTLSLADFRIQDWKKLLPLNSPHFEEEYKGKFDRVVHTEMIEAVSTKDLQDFFHFLYACLNDDGILGFQAINSDRFVHTTNGFIDKYIFPDGVIPQHLYMMRCAEIAGFRGETTARDMANMAYNMALKEWWGRLDEWYNILEEEDPQLKEKLDFFFNRRKHQPFPYRNHPSFMGIFEYYLLSCAGSFRAGYNNVGLYKFYKSSRNTVREIISPTKDEIQYILGTTHFGEMPKTI